MASIPIGPQHHNPPENQLYRHPYHLHPNQLMPPPPHQRQPPYYNQVEGGAAGRNAVAGDEGARPETEQEKVVLLLERFITIEL